MTNITKWKKNLVNWEISHEGQIPDQWSWVLRQVVLQMPVKQENYRLFLQNEVQGWLRRVH